MASINYKILKIEIDPRFPIGYKFIHYHDKKEYEVVDHRITYFPKSERTEIGYVVKHDNGVQQVYNWSGIAESTIFRSTEVTDE